MFFDFAIAWAVWHRVFIICVDLRVETLVVIVRLLLDLVEVRARACHREVVVVLSSRSALRLGLTQYSFLKDNRQIGVNIDAMQGAWSANAFIQALGRQVEPEIRLIP
jgi:hypothetical protein